MYGRQISEILKEVDIIIKFKEIQKMQKLPFCIYADFEALNIKISNCNQKIDIASPTKQTHHEVCEFTYLLVSEYR